MSPHKTIGKGLKSRDNEPAFGEPWHAQVMAMARLLIESGTISASEWTNMLSDEIRTATCAGSPDGADTYFGAVISGLERLLISGSRITREELDHRKEEWAHAYDRTPHGQPVTL